MIIATWNLQRLERDRQNRIIQILEELNADILILTETNLNMQLRGYYQYATEALPAFFDGISYATGEKRVSILSRYPALLKHKTYDEYTTVCVDLDTPAGILTVYGVLIGVFGNRQPRFNEDLRGHLQDFDSIFPGKQVCLAGDFNVTFSGRVWPGKAAREMLAGAFETFDLVNTTGHISDTVDHIVLSRHITENRKIQIDTWNIDKKLSDHHGHRIHIASGE
jgi:exonuclease III